MESQLSDQDNSNPNVFEDRTENQIGMSILDLNEHCLLQVFRFLDVYDAIQLGETCKLLHKVLKLAMTKYKKFVVTRYEGYNFMRMLERFQQTLPLEKVLSYVAPHIESLDARTSIYQADNFAMIGHSPLECTSRAELLQTLLQFHMPKIKSLIVQNSADLINIISRRTLQKLTVYDVNANDLNKYAHGMTNLTKLHLHNISQYVAIDELSPLVKNNPNIENLCFIFEITADFQSIEFPEDFFQKLPHLKQLELSIGTNVENLKNILQIKQLTKLALEFRNSHQLRVEFGIFLRQLSAKNTVRSLELRGVYLSSDDPIYKTLASMDLISLTIAPSYTSNFVSGLTQASFLTLKHLNISHPASIDDIILIIKRFTSLEQLVLVMLLKLYDANELSPRLSELLKVTPTTRPDMELKVLKPSASVKVNKFKIFFFRNLRLIFKLQFSDLLSSWQLRIYKLASVLQWLPTISFRLRIKIIYLRTYPRRCIIYF